VGEGYIPFRTNGAKGARSARHGATGWEATLGQGLAAVPYLACDDRSHPQAPPQGARRGGAARACGAQLPRGSLSPFPP